MATRRSNKFSAHIYDSGEHLGEKAGLVARIHPSGCTGAVIRSAVYPLRGSDDSGGFEIHLQDSAASKDTCGFWPASEPFRLLDPAQRISVATSLVWSIEQTKYSTYLLVDGDVPELEIMLDALRRMNISFDRHAKSWRPAKDGHHYDWFIRLSGDFAPEDLEEKLRLYLGNSDDVRGPELITDGRSSSSGISGDDWHLETNKYGHYLVLDGSENQLEVVLDRLDQSEIGVRSFGPSHRAADNDRHYDWYIRLELGLDTDTADLIAKLESILGDNTYHRVLDEIVENPVFEQLGHVDSSLVDEFLDWLPQNLTPEALNPPISVIPRWLSGLVRSARDEINALNGIEASQDKRIAELRVELQSVAKRSRSDTEKAARAERELDSIRHHIVTLEQELDRRLDTEKTAPDSKNLENEFAELEKANRDLTRLLEEIDEWQALAEEAENRNVDLLRKLDEMQQSFNTLEAQLKLERGSRHRPGIGPASRPKIRSKYLAMIQQALLSLGNLQFHSEVDETIEEAFERPDALFRVLRRLDRGDSVRRRSLENAPNWSEVSGHISTGRDNLGRVYVRRLDSGRLYVLVDRKQNSTQQSRLVASLEKLDLTRTLEDKLDKAP